MAAPANLSMNQTLEGHNGIVMCLAWNPCHQKLTTSDESGLIIVWRMHKGVWYEEMINNRNKSVVRDMKWTSDGKKICIVYEDGAVIVGSVDGNRLWGKEFNMSLHFVQWSPDCRFILFGSGENDIWLYDSDGARVKQMPLVIGKDSGAKGGGGDDRKIVSIEWYDGKGGPSGSSNKSSFAANVVPAPSLAVALESGLIQLCRSVEDANPVILDPHMTISSCKWNADGTVLTVTGYQLTGGTNSRGENMVRENLVKFFTNMGEYVRTLRIPGDDVKGLSWEGSNLRIAMAVDSFIYFANNRPSYVWAYLLDTVIYTRARPDRGETVAMFWDLNTGETVSKHVVNLKFIVAHGDFCAFVVIEKNSSTAQQTATAASKVDDKKDDGGMSTAAVATVNNKTTLCSVQLRNAIGAIIDVKGIPFVPTHVAMGPFHIAVANDRTVYTWQYMSATSKAGHAPSGLSGATSSVAMGMAAANMEDNDGDNGRQKGGSKEHLRSGGKERIFDIANVQIASPQSPETFTVITEEILDPISCLTLSDKFLVVAHHNGSLIRFTLPHLSMENTYSSNSVPMRIALNSSSTRLSIIDEVGVLSVLDLDVRLPAGATHSSENDSMLDHSDEKHSQDAAVIGRKMGIDRRDVWDMCWAEDNEEMLCVMEKTKMVIMRGEIAEAPVQSAGYLARFRELEVRSVNLDDLLLVPETPDKDCVIDYESKDLREVRDKIAAENVMAGYNLANNNPHPRLWKLIAEKSLEELDFSTAEKAFVREENYYGIQLVKQLRTMTDKNKAKAEVAVFLGKFDEAEAIYRGIDRKDLALQMRNRVGDYSRVVQLLQTGGGNDKLIRVAWDRIGDHYSDRFKWKKAIQYYSQCANYEKLAECYYRLKMYGDLTNLSTMVPDGTPLLTTLAEMFDSVGMYEQAVDVYLRSNNPRAAVDCCILQNRWEKALELAEIHDFPQTEGLLQRFAGDLIMKKKWLEAVELYRRANRPTEAAILLGEIAERAATKDVKPSLAKKLHVLAALEVERHRKRTMDAASNMTTKGGKTGQGTVAQATAATLETLMMTSLEANATTTTLVGQTTNNTSANKTSKAFANAWRGAAAYHYYMLAQRQYYAGQMDAAMKTSIKLCEYDDILPPRDIYSLLALSAYHNKFYGICSQAFVKLETLPNVPESVKDDIETLAVKIFSVHVPTDPASLPDVYMRCLEVSKPYKACVITGRYVRNVVVWLRLID